MFLRSIVPATTLVLAGMIMPAAAQWRNYDGYQAAPPASYYRAPVPAPVPDDAGFEDEYMRAKPRRSRGFFAPDYYGNGGPDESYSPRGYGRSAYGPSSSGPATGLSGGDADLNVASDQRTGTLVRNATGQAPGTIVVDTRSKHLYLVLGDGSAMQYGIGVGRQGFSWKGEARVDRKAEWPAWYPPKEMLKRRPDLPEHMEGGLANPLGARALYLYQGNKDTLFRIHGTNEPDTIGRAVSSGCIRMMNADVVDLYKRVPVGTRVVVI